MTDNSEAVEKLVDVMENTSDDALGSGHTILSMRIMAQEILAAIQANPLAYVKLKPLEWEKDTRADYRKLWASSVGIIYEINVGNEGGAWLYVNSVCLDIKPQETLEAAQAAAETHRNEKLLKEFAK